MRLLSKGGSSATWVGVGGNGVKVELAVGGMGVCVGGTSVWVGGAMVLVGGGKV